jgi:hypothetical protein
MRTAWSPTLTRRRWADLIGAAALPSWGALSDPPSLSPLPCTDSWTRVSPDTPVFFPDENLERLAVPDRMGPFEYLDTTGHGSSRRNIASAFTI